jgi:hypothetical protein
MSNISNRFPSTLPPYRPPEEVPFDSPAYVCGGPPFGDPTAQPFEPGFILDPGGGPPFGDPTAKPGESGFIEDPGGGPPGGDPTAKPGEPGYIACY